MVDDATLSVCKMENSTESVEQSLSKRAQKRLLKRKRWEDTRQDRRKAQKEKLKARIQKIHYDVHLGKLEKSALDGIRTSSLRRQLKAATMEQSQCRVAVAIDLTFADMMTDHEMAKCCKQIMRCYSINRRLDQPVQMHLTSVDRLKTAMNRHNGWKYWDVNFHADNYIDALLSDQSSPLKKICYLTSESDTVLDGRLDPECAYIIGGLVDHNRLKGVTRDAVDKTSASEAKSDQISHARLPIDRYVNVKSRHVLTIDQVFDILSRVAQLSICTADPSDASDDIDYETAWKQALYNVLPARKLSSKSE